MALEKLWIHVDLPNMEIGLEKSRLKVKKLKLTLMSLWEPEIDPGESDL